MNVMIDVHGGGYALACECCYDANHGVVGAVSTLTDVAAGGAEMAGDDSSGVAWAAQYDAAAATALGAGCDLGTTLATLAHLLDASLANHDAADGGALLYGVAVAPPSAGDGSGRSALELTVTGLPSAAGGTGEEPIWWHWVAAHLLGLLWPDADTGRLRTVGAGWVKAGDTIASYRADVDNAAAMVADQISPEVHDAVAACDEVADQVRALASAYAAIGHACLDYAQAVEDAHHRIEHELASFIAWTAGIEVAGALTGLVTAGIGEGVAQGVEGTRIAAAAAKVRSILTALADVAATIRAAIGTAIDAVAQISTRLAKYLVEKVERALVRVGLKEGETMLPQLNVNALQLLRKFKHAEAFGLTGNANPANAQAFGELLQNFVNSPSTTRVIGTYRGQPAILSFDEHTHQVVVQYLDGTFWSAWRPGPAAMHHVIQDHSLGGG